MCPFPFYVALCAHNPPALQTDRRTDRQTLKCSLMSPCQCESARSRNDDRSQLDDHVDLSPRCSDWPHTHTHTHTQSTCTALRWSYYFDGTGWYLLNYSSRPACRQSHAGPRQSVNMHKTVSPKWLPIADFLVNLSFLLGWLRLIGDHYCG